ncbi:uncharacterized protein BX664DRAFT_351048 [Halteromyces radiatus]|uniref:uncharacterized protein n=1 Tax=Halteromyces radiatus TaxID=101107 RepID=UPI00221E9AA0|nr:uncharacterized protein BX664DRAFT_351048 [Halteromyces radiatus]KAI8086651.1 hypothetical protein BX664DRAFT_351048 [Halteromyces radiatus]
MVSRTVLFLCLVLSVTSNPITAPGSTSAGTPQTAGTGVAKPSDQIQAPAGDMGPSQPTDDQLKNVISCVKASGVTTSNVGEVFHRCVKVVFGSNADNEA